MRRRALLGILVLLATFALAGPIRAETRIALVIGNGAYPSSPLASPKHDAEAVARKLSELGFAVTKEVDLGGAALRKVISTFGERLKRPGTVGLFYYSGHGMQVNNRNYMIPLDAEILDEADVEEAGVPMESVLTKMEEARSNPNIIILDACRRNWIPKSLKSAQAGLAQMRPPASTLIAFAAAPGQAAWAAFGGRLSPYTEALIEHIATPGQDLIKMFQTVQNAVWRLTQGRQHPHVEFTPGLPEFSFAPVVAAISASPPVPPPTAPPAAPAAGLHPSAPGKPFKDCADCPEMLVVPAGSFLMGSPESEEGHSAHEGPQHRVTFAKPFALGRYEVTFAEWDTCVAAGGCNGYSPDFQGPRGRLPVTNVSWQDANAYVVWLSKKTGKAYRLPSEGEWEYAARAGTMTPFALPPANGSIGIGGRSLANCDGCGSRWDGKSPAPVGSFPANAWGFHDLHGNVLEWVEDHWHDSYWGAPNNGSAWRGEGGENSTGYRVIRGGSWYDNLRYLRAAHRDASELKFRYYDRGFRAAQTLE